MSQTPLSLSSVIALLFLIIIGLSIFLQYISHRHVVDSRYEREQKIKDQLGTEQIKVESFTEREYDIQIRVYYVDVREKDGILYNIARLLVPTSDIDGTTVVKMGIHPESEMPYGIYMLRGWDESQDNPSIIRGILTTTPDSDENDMSMLEVDIVNMYTVPPTLTEGISYTPGLSLDDMSDDPEKFGQMAEDLATPNKPPSE